METLFFFFFRCPLLLTGTSCQKQAFYFYFLCLIKLEPPNERGISDVWKSSKQKKEEN